MTTDNLAYLIGEVEAALDEEGLFHLYEFSWYLRSHDESLSESEIEDICHRAYESIVTRHDLKLMWTGWPTDLGRAREAAPGTPLDFDINSTGTPPDPMLTLVEPEMLPSADD